jgi:hypothetical protein
MRREAKRWRSGEKCSKSGRARSGEVAGMGKGKRGGELESCKEDT